MESKEKTKNKRTFEDPLNIYISDIPIWGGVLTVLGPFCITLIVLMRR